LPGLIAPGGVAGWMVGSLLMGIRGAPAIGHRKRL
jgi:hypothetical protein